MKSMKEFTDSLAKMKLPMDVGNGTTSSGDSSTDQNSQGSNTPSSRVFYGSSAFFWSLIEKTLCGWLLD